MILPRQALENNVLISDDNLLFLAINCAYTVPLNYGPFSFIPGLWNVKSESQKASKGHLQNTWNLDEFSLVIKFPLTVVLFL